MNSREVCTSLLLVILILTASAGCTNRFIYDRADRLVQFYIERFVDLDKEQSRFLRINLASVIEWHRQDELSSYLKFLDRMESDVQAEITGDMVAGWADQLRLYYAQIRDQVLPSLIEIAQTMTESQIEEFAANMEQRNAKMEKELLSRNEAKYHDSILEEMEHRLSDWLGRLTPGQKQRLQQAAAEYERLDREWLDNRRTWQKRIIAELRREQGWQARLSALVRNRTEYVDEEHMRASLRNDRRIYDAVAEVLNMRTDRQQRYLMDKLQQWRSDLAALQNTSPTAG